MIATLLVTFSCTKTEPIEVEETFTLTVGLSDGAVKTTLAAPVEGKRKMYWIDGDCLALNGSTSDALSGLAPESTSASFTFHGSFSSPYNLLYPASFYKNATTITLPSTQSWADGTLATDLAPLACQVVSLDDPASIQHLCNIMYLRVRKNSGVSPSRLVSVKFKGNADEQVCGDFTIDYSVPSLTPAGTGREVTLTLNESLSESEDLDIYMVVPAMTYSSGFSVTLEDEYHRTMTKTKSGSTVLAAGKLSKMTAFEFVPSALSTEFSIDDVDEEVIPMDAYNVTGRVVNASTGAGLEGVVVSDGLQCVRTMFDGTFYMQSAVPGTKFVFVSSPSGYMPEVSGGIPRFYKLLSDITPAGGIYDFGDFEMTPVANPDRYTLLITADPQPRGSDLPLDKVAYSSLDVCEDLYYELGEVASGIAGRQVYGICLGDIVHEDMTLFSNYASALTTLGYPTYNVIGNHDNYPYADNDDEAAEDFENYFGPRNYSFNIGGIHFVVLDNLMMKKKDGKLTDFDQGLTDRIWAWLQADMSYVPTSTKIMVCAHSPMFKLESGNERTNSAYHAGTRSDKDGGAFGYGDLFDKYTEVHAWAGHTHSSFNFVYASNHRHKRVQVHTLARSTGEFWTNEYLANGTPRGFTVVEVDNGNITWKFHPLTRQTAAFRGAITGYCSAGAPGYLWRDWNYDGSGFADMKDGSGPLDDSYQLHVYPYQSYGDDYVYANVFLWDENWETPVWTPSGGASVEMTRINSPENHYIIADTLKRYDRADAEIRAWYKENANVNPANLHDMDDYRTVAVDKITTIFRAPASASPNNGTVSVTDRFGNTYSRSVSW